MSRADIFSEIYHSNFWNDKESVSGSGSNMAETEVIRQELPTLCKKLGISSLLDIPCGDFYWLSKTKGLEDIVYTGADIVEALIMDNFVKFPDRNWLIRDAVEDELPAVDMIFCRDMLGHLPNADAKKAIKNFRASGSLYLLATTFPDVYGLNADIQAGQWRPINLADWKFGLGEPLTLITEGVVDGLGGIRKCMGLWLLNEH